MSVMTAPTVHTLRLATGPRSPTSESSSSTPRSSCSSERHERVRNTILDLLAQKRRFNEFMMRGGDKVQELHERMRRLEEKVYLSEQTIRLSEHKLYLSEQNAQRSRAQAQDLEGQVERLEHRMKGFKSQLGNMNAEIAELRKRRNSGAAMLALNHPEAPSRPSPSRPVRPIRHHALTWKELLTQGQAILGRHLAGFIDVDTTNTQNWVDGQWAACFREAMVYLCPGGRGSDGDRASTARQHFLSVVGEGTKAKSILQDEALFNLLIAPPSWIYAGQPQLTDSIIDFNAYDPQKAVIIASLEGLRDIICRG